MGEVIKFETGFKGIPIVKASDDTLPKDESKIGASYSGPQNSTKETISTPTNNGDTLTSNTPFIDVIVSKLQISPQAQNLVEMAQSYDHQLNHVDQSKRVITPQNPITPTVKHYMACVPVKDFMDAKLAYDSLNPDSLRSLDDFGGIIAYSGLIARSFPTKAQDLFRPIGHTTFRWNIGGLDQIVMNSAHQTSGHNIQISASGTIVFEKISSTQIN